MFDRFRGNQSLGLIFQLDGDGGCSCLAGVSDFHHVGFFCSLFLSLSSSILFFSFAFFVLHLVSSPSFRSRHTSISLTAFMLNTPHKHGAKRSSMFWLVLDEPTPWWIYFATLWFRRSLRHWFQTQCTSSWRKFTVSHHFLFLLFQFFFILTLMQCSVCRVVTLLPSKWQKNCQCFMIELWTCTERRGIVYHSTSPSVLFLWNRSSLLMITTT